MRGEADYSDTELWKRLAKKRKIRLPFWRRPLSTGGMRSYLKRLNVEVSEYLEYIGGGTLKKHVARNPDLPLRAWVGETLEWVFWRNQPDQQIPASLMKAEKNE